MTQREKYAAMTVSFLIIGAAAAGLHFGVEVGVAVFCITAVLVR